MVTTGFNCTQTDADGRYALTSDLELRRFVFVSVPAEYEIPARHGCPQFFRRIDRFQKEVKADFVLEPRLVPPCTTRCCAGRPPDQELRRRRIGPRPTGRWSFPT